MAKYIPLDALVAEIESKIEKLRFNLKICKTENDRKTINLYIGCYNGIISLIDTLEVKEVDLDKELVNYNRECVDENGFFNTEHLAKHFFELGMQVSNKAQKGE